TLLDTGPNTIQSILLLTDGRHNTNPSIAQFLAQYNPADDQFFIHVVAVGYPYGVGETILLDLLDDLDGTSDDVIERGTYRRIENSEDLPIKIFKVFNDILLLNNQSAMITDPIEEIEQGDPAAETSAVISADQTSATFSVFWQGYDNALEMAVQAPDGRIITKNNRNNRIRYSEDDNYMFMDLSFPLSGSLNSAHEGEWKLLVSVRDGVPSGIPVKFTSTIAGLGETKLEPEFYKASNFTGEPIVINARLTRGGQPLTGASVDVVCDIPVTAIGNILHDSDIQADELDSAAEDSNDSEADPVDEKLTMIEEETGEPLIERVLDSIRLYDDGQHHDGEANDGVYGYSYTKTITPGNYNFRIIASNIPTDNGETTTREWTVSYYNEVLPDEDKTDFQISILGPGQEKRDKRFRVRFVPKDKYGNYLGPGHIIKMQAYTYNPGIIFTRDLKDNYDGTYTAEFTLSQTQMDHDPQMKIMINDLEFTEKKIPTYYQGQVSLHGGTVIPLPALNSLYNMGISATVDLGYWISKDFAVLLLLDYNHFFPVSASEDDLMLPSASLDIKYKLDIVRQDFSAYALAGVTAYFPDFNSFTYGANGGIGFEKNLSEHLLLDICARYHYMIETQDMFLQATAGLVYKFQTSH
ncbi:MAG: hypothetical protein JW874_05890, partial [Spirochaetales bacterium]|nr:hypothetical protein [Spirochaetales bacterium]